LRGFPDVAIYRNADFRLRTLEPAQIPAELHTPQPEVYATVLEELKERARLFAGEGIDLLHLTSGYDFVARADDGSETDWTILPPIVERFAIDKTDRGTLDYQPLIGPVLQTYCDRENVRFDPLLATLPHSSESGMFSLINDGSHRIYLGYQTAGVTVLEITNMTPGFPYYAAPQPYASSEVLHNVTAIEHTKKIYVLEAPHHKQLYRNFPSAGILSGTVRPPVEGEVYL